MARGTPLFRLLARPGSVDPGIGHRVACDACHDHVQTQSRLQTQTQTEPQILAQSQTQTGSIRTVPTQHHPTSSAQSASNKYQQSPSPHTLDVAAAPMPVMYYSNLYHQPHSFPLSLVPPYTNYYLFPPPTPGLHLTDSFWKNVFWVL